MGWFWSTEPRAPLPTVSGKCELFEKASQVILASYTFHLKCKRTDSNLPALMEEFPERLRGMISHRGLDLKTMIECRDEICEEMMGELIPTGFLLGSFDVEDLVEKIDLSFTAEPKKIPAPKPPPPPKPEVIIKTVVKEKIVYRDRPAPPSPKYSSPLEEKLDKKIQQSIDVAKAASKLKEKYKDQIEKDPDLKEDIEGILEMERIKSLAPKGS